MFDIEHLRAEHLDREASGSYSPDCLYTLDEVRPTLIPHVGFLRGVKRVKAITEGRIMQAYWDANHFNISNLEINPTKRLGHGEVAFLIHPRSISDIALQFPHLSEKYLEEHEIKSNFKLIPPFRASRITGLRDRNDEELRGWIVVSSILPEQLTDRGELRWVKENILQTAKLAYMLGADIIGLGAMSAMFTHYGKDIEEKLVVQNEDGTKSPAMHVTTGHSYTSFLVHETLEESAKRTGQELKNSVVAVVGAAGSIGRTAAHLCFPEVGKLVLIDTKNKEGKVSEFVNTERQHHQTEVEIGSVAGTNDPTYPHFLKQADFIICATTAVEPFIQRDWLKPGVIVIDDSAPVNIAEGEAEIVGGMTLHVVANIPRKLRWNFPLTLDNASFGCGAEVAALAAQQRYDLCVTGEVTNERMYEIAEVAKATGFTLGPLQSFGKLKTRVDFERIRYLKGRLAA